MAKLTAKQKKNMKKIRPAALGVRSVVKKVAKKVAKKTVSAGKSVRVSNGKRKLKITNQPGYNKSTTAKPGRQRYARRRK